VPIDRLKDQSTQTRSLTGYHRGRWVEGGGKGWKWAGRVYGPTDTSVELTGVPAVGHWGTWPLEQFIFV